MTTIADAVSTLREIAPLELAEEWDNVGLLAGDPAAPLERLMTCLTLTPDVAQEAIDRRADLVVTHHPLPFRPLQRITTDSVPGATLWRLLGAGVAIYSAHTAFDSAAGGINQQWAEGIGLESPEPFTPPTPPRADGAGTGRIGAAPHADFDRLIEDVKRVAGVTDVKVIPPSGREPRRVAFACGSGGSLLAQAVDAGADVLVTGEATFHECLLAESLGVGLILTGHYASERFAMERLAEQIGEIRHGIECWASSSETEPLRPA